MRQTGIQAGRERERVGGGEGGGGGGGVEKENRDVHVLVFFKKSTNA